MDMHNQQQQKGNKSHVLNSVILKMNNLLMTAEASLYKVYI